MDTEKANHLARQAAMTEPAPKIDNVRLPLANTQAGIALPGVDQVVPSMPDFGRENFVTLGELRDELHRLRNDMQRADAGVADHMDKKIGLLHIEVRKARNEATLAERRTRDMMIDTGALGVGIANQERNLRILGAAVILLGLGQLLHFVVA